MASWGLIVPREAVWVAGPHRSTTVLVAGASGLLSLVHPGVRGRLLSQALGSYLISPLRTDRHGVAVGREAWLYAGRMTNGSVVRQ
jgi:hypothetical protein